MAKKIIKGLDAQKGIIDGVIDIANAIETTIGPSGKCVAIENGMIPPEITRDGVTVAKSISFKDGSKNIGAQLVRKAASLTETEAGDGTSTTSLLIKEFCTRGRKALNVGRNVNEIKTGMLKAEKWIKDFISKNSISVSGDIEKVRQVATISANNDSEVGDLIVKSIETVGMDGVITAELSSGLENSIEVTEGMKLDRGWSSPYYVNEGNSESKCIMEDCYILVCGTRLSSAYQLENFFKWITEPGNSKPFLLICDGIDDSVNTVITMNNLHGAIRCCVVKDIDFGDSRKNIMQDIATKTGATYFCQETGRDINSWVPNDLGHAKKVVVSRDNTIIYQGAGNVDEIAKRADILRACLEDPSRTEYDKVKFSKRLANLTGGISIIKAGGATEVEKQNRKATIEDAILASKSAISEGVVPGGGYIYYKSSLLLTKDKDFWTNMTEDEKEGAKIVIDSLSVSMRTIANNAGVSADVVLDTVKNNITKKTNYGFNAKTKTYENLVENGILDSSKVIRVALENSISTAAMILATDCVLLEEVTESSLIDKK